MLVLILVGLFSLVTGNFVISRGLRLVGKKARIYGAILLVLSLPYSIIISLILNFLIPRSILTNTIAGTIINVLVLFLIIVGLAIPFREKN